MTARSEPIVTAGIFDRGEALDAAGKQLASEGIENAAHEETIVAGLIGGDSTRPIPLHPDRILSAITCRLSDSSAMVQEFKAGFPTIICPTMPSRRTRSHSAGKEIVLVKTDASQADRATEILRGLRASRISRND